MAVTIEPVRLDEEKLEALRAWGERLRQGGGEESAAVGRAILMLVEEIDRLHIDLWHARTPLVEDEQVAVPETTSDENEPVLSSLHARVRRALGSRSDPPEAPQPVDGAADTSAQAWIDGLRRPD